MSTIEWVAFVGSPRDEILEKVKHGEMTPEQAESESTRLGVGPLATGGDPRKFDPMQESMWTLPMTIAWIMWRSIDGVTEMWDLYRRTVRYWYWQRWQIPGGPVCNGHFLETQDRAGLWDLQVSATPWPGLYEVTAYKDAIRLFRIHAQAGGIAARGLPTDGGGPRIIPAEEWDDLHPYEINKLPVLRFQSRGFPAIGYDRVLVPRKEILRLFPAPTRAKVGVSAISKCQSWLEGLMNASPHERPKPRTQLARDASAKFGLSGRGFQQAWTAAIISTGASAWMKGGRPRNPLR